jgi:hypothetical protein
VPAHTRHHFFSIIFTFFTLDGRIISEWLGDLYNSSKDNLGIPLESIGICHSSLSQETMGCIACLTSPLGAQHQYGESRPGLRVRFWVKTTSSLDCSTGHNGHE